MGTSTTQARVRCPSEGITSLAGSKLSHPLPGTKNRNPGVRRFGPAILGAAAQIAAHVTRRKLPGSQRSDHEVGEIRKLAGSP